MSFFKTESKKNSEKRKALEQIIKIRQEFEKNNFRAPYSNHPTTIDFCDSEGLSLLYYAIEDEDFASVKLLISAKANINLKTGRPAKSPIEIALQKGNLNLAMLLFENGADCSTILLQSIRDKVCKAWFKEKIQQGLSQFSDDTRHQQIFAQDNYSTSAVQRAIEIGDFDYLQENINIVLSQPLPNLINVASANGHLEIIQFFVSLGEKINPENPYVNSALQEAVCYGHVKVMEYLLQQGADLNWQNNLKETPIMIALESNNDALFNDLLNKKPNLTLMDVHGNTIFHKACAKGNLSMLGALLKEQNTQELLTSKNIYELTPMVIAFQHNHKELMELLSLYVSEKISVELDLIEINQGKLIDRFNYFLRLNYRSLEFFSKEGFCNGLTFLFLLYSAMDREDYFFDSLKLIVKWNGNSELLEKEFDKTMPQAKYYANLRELLEQWIHDLTLFQHPYCIPGINISPDDRFSQQALVNTDPDYIPHPIFSLRRGFTGIELNRHQLAEILTIFKKMPIGTRLDLGGSEHKTGGYVNESYGITYYDSNFRLRTKPLLETSDLTRRIIDTKYIWTKKNSDENICATINFFYFAKDKEKHQHFNLFSSEEFPKNAEESLNFQKNSPCQFTHLHAAIISRSTASLKRLLQDGYCNLNAKDNLINQTPIEWAFEQNYPEAIDMLLDKKEIIIDEYHSSFYRCKNKELIDKLINHPNTSDLILLGLICDAIKGNDLELINQLLPKIDTNNNATSQTLFKFAIENPHDELFRLFIAKGIHIDLFSETKQSTTLLKEIIFNRPQYLKLVLNPDNINQLDAYGKAAIHYVMQTGDAELLQYLSDQGADLNLKNKNNNSPLIEINSNSFQDEKNIMYLFNILEKNNPKNLSDYNAIFNLIFECIEGQHSLELFTMLLSKLPHSFLNNHHSSGIGLLHSTIVYRKYDMAALLLEKGADINLKTNTVTNNTCMHYMINQKYPEKYLQMFLEYQPDLNISNAKGKTIMDLVNESNDVDLQALFKESLSVGL